VNDRSPPSSAVDGIQAHAKPPGSAPIADMGTARHSAPMDQPISAPQRIMRGTWSGAGFGCLITAPAIFAAVMSAGAGHGTYIAARVLFPFSLLLTRLEGSIGPFAVGVGVLQFTIYGALVGRAVALGARAPLLLITVAHLVAVLACFSGLLPAFPEGLKTAFHPLSAVQGGHTPKTRPSARDAKTDLSAPALMPDIDWRRPETQSHDQGTREKP